MSSTAYIRSFRQARAGYERFDRRNHDYTLWGSRYAHVEIWRAHHGVILDTEVYVIHHRDHDKKNNTVCSRDDGRCPDWSCGNLGAMTRADHIREHKPGRMGGRKIPNYAGRKRYYCEDCGAEKSRNGRKCRACFRAA